MTAVPPCAGDDLGDDGQARGRCRQSVRARASSSRTNRSKTRSRSARRYARPVVVDVQHRRAVPLGQRERDPLPRVPGGVVDRGCAAPGAASPGRRRPAPRTRRWCRPRTSVAVAQPAAPRRGPGRRGRPAVAGAAAVLVGAGQQQQVVDERLHAQALRVRGPRPAPAARAGWASATSACWRIAAIGDRSSWEASATNRRCRCVRLLEPVEHPVHGGGEPADLVAGRGLRHPPVQLRGGDRVHLGADRVDRRQRPADHPPRRCTPTTSSSTGSPTASSVVSVPGRLAHRVEALPEQHGPVAAPARRPRGTGRRRTARRSPGTRPAPGRPARAGRPALGLAATTSPVGPSTCSDHVVVAGHRRDRVAAGVQRPGPTSAARSVAAARTSPDQRRVQARRPAPTAPTSRATADDARPRPP